MSNSEEKILNISQAERGRKERLLTEIAQNYLGERGFKAIPQFTIHRSFEYRIHPGNELREAIEKDVLFPAVFGIRKSLTATVMSTD